MLSGWVAILVMERKVLALTAQPRSSVPYHPRYNARANRVFTVGMEWRERREEKSREAATACHGHKALPSPVKIARQLLILVKRNWRKTFPTTLYYPARIERSFSNSSAAL